MVESSQYTILDIAAGTGMLSTGVKLALELIGLRAVTVGGIERESCAAAAFLAWMEVSQGFRPPVWDDAKTFVGRRDRRLEPVDIVAAGYPCQPFSSAGKRAGTKDPRHLWPAVRRIVARTKPGIVFFENVDGHVSLGLWKVLRDLERLGYRVAPGVFSAEEVGAPHLRKRVFIFGVADAGGGGWGPRTGRERVCSTSEAVGESRRSSSRRDESRGRADRRVVARRAGSKLGHAKLPGIFRQGWFSFADEGREGTSDGHDELGDADGGRHRGQSDTGEQDGRIDRRVEELGHTEERGRSDVTTEPGGVTEAESESVYEHRELAYAQRITGSTKQQHEAGERSRSCSTDGPMYGDGGTQLADDNQPRLEGGRPATGMPSGDGSLDGGCGIIPIFPPHRTDYRRWAQLAALGLDPTSMPAVESGFSVLADGLASSADILRIGGNGVCPLTAAWAFLNLACCVLEIEEPAAAVGADGGQL